MISRRQFLIDAGLVILGTTIGGLSLNTGCKSAPKTTPAPSVPDLSYLENADPATADNQNLPVTPLNGLHVSPDSEAMPVFKISDYSLRVYGLVDNPLTLTLEEFQQFDRVTQTILLICPNTLVDNPEWSGVLLSTLLNAAGVQSTARGVIFHSISGLGRNGSIANAGSILFADKVDGVSLPAAHGYPIRVVQPHLKGSESLKWVNGIEVTAVDLAH